ncbi:MAG: hypothetical protein KJ000_24970 [Pirellulaceae bacterium]|nr:hypothetical protein [Pirellulaceae bacterium]
MHEPIIEQARKFLSWLDATQVPATAGAVLPRTDLHRFRELANGVWQAWFVATVEAGHRLPDDTEAAFRAFEDAVFSEDWNGRVLIVQQVRQQQTRFPSFPVHDPWELAYDPARLAAVRKSLERIAGPRLIEEPLAPPAAESDDDIPWSKPEPPKNWADMFNCSERTFKRRVENGTIHARKLSTKAYQVDKRQIPKTRN